jgi:cobalt-zinc-cadmium efflux system membrane fusion protein
VQPVELHTFRTEHLTEGKIAVDEDRSTPIFSQYAGRITKLLVAPGDMVQRGQPLFVLEASDSVQAQSDFITALAGVNKARTQLRLAETVERRMQSLHEAKAMPLKDWQQSQADLATTENDLRSAQTALEAMRNRLRILGKTDAEIESFQQTGTITADSTMHAPLSGTIVLRKVGPGQFVTAGSSDPVFVIGDLSTVWLVAFVRESAAPKVKVGQTAKFRVLAYPDQEIEARINHVATALDPASRRLMVRATVDNSDGLLKPEMFASVRIVVADDARPQPGLTLVLSPATSTGPLGSPHTVTATAAQTPNQGGMPLRSSRMSSPPNIASSRMIVSCGWLARAPRRRIRSGSSPRARFVAASATILRREEDS